MSTSFGQYELLIVLPITILILSWDEIFDTLRRHFPRHESRMPNRFLHLGI